MLIKLKQKGQKQVDIVLFTLHGYVFSEKYRILKRMFFFLYFCYISLFCKVCSSGWTIRPMFDQSSASWYNRVRSLTTSRNRLNLTLLYVSQYSRIFLYFKQFSKLSFNKSVDFSRILCLFITTAIFTGSGCFW